MSANKSILVTGGTGFIGSHTCVALSQAGHEVIIYDNLSNSHVGVIDRLGAITGKRPIFVRGDVRDSAALDRVFAEYPIGTVKCIVDPKVKTKNIFF